MKWNELKELIDKKIKDNELENPEMLYDDGGSVYDINDVSTDKEKNSITVQ